MNDLDDQSIFTDVIKKVDSGVIILDIQDESVFFLNNHAARLLQNIGQQDNYQSIFLLLFGAHDSPSVADIALIRKETIQCSGKILGYSVYPLREGGARYIAVFIQDITEQKRLDSIASAVEMSKNIGLIFSGIRHEIGNPVNSIKMALAVLHNSGYSFSEDDLRKYCCRMSDDIGRLERLLLAFKNFNLFELPVPEAIDLRDFITTLADLVSEDLKQHNISFRADSTYKGKVVVDPRALQQISLNIITNAKDALSEKGGGEIKVSCSEGEKMVLIRFADSGCGIDDEQMRHIFKPFHTSKIDGTGLGLVIAKKMLSAMNCAIEIESEAGKGTTVTFVVPKGGGVAEKQAVV